MSEPIKSILIQLADADLRKAPDLRVDLVHISVFLRAWLRFDRAQVVGMLADGLTPSEEIIPKWVRLKRKSKVVFEIGCELPVYLPNRANDWEYVATVGGRDYTVCNRLLKCQFTVEGEVTNPYSYTICHQKHLAPEGRTLVSKEPLRSVISTVFVLNTDDTRKEFERHYIEWSEQLLAAGNALIDGARMTGVIEPDYNLNTYSRPVFWVVCLTQAETEGPKVVCHQVMGRTHDAILAPLTDTDDARWSKMLAIANDPDGVDEADYALANARTFARYKYRDLAVVQVCVSVESALARSLKLYLGTKGVKGEALAGRFRDVSTLFHLLNTQVYLLLDVRADPLLVSSLSALEWARQKRNKIVHESAAARAKIDEKRLRDAITGAARLINCLRSAGYLPASVGQPNGATPKRNPTGGSRKAKRTESSESSGRRRK